MDKQTTGGILMNGLELVTPQASESTGHCKILVWHWHRFDVISFERNGVHPHAL